MMKSEHASPSPEAKITLDALCRAVSKALEKKRRLGQYAVIWRDGGPYFLGEEFGTDHAEGAGRHADENPGVAEPQSHYPQDDE